MTGRGAEAVHCGGQLPRRPGVHEGVRGVGAG